MKKIMLGLFAGMLLAQAAMYGGQPIGSKNHKDDIVTSKPAQNEPKMLLLSREKKGSRLGYTVSTDPIGDIQWLYKRIAEGQAAIKYQSAGECKITIYELNLSGNPVPVQYVWIDKADTNVIGYLTVFIRSNPESPYYINYSDPVTANRTLQNTAGVKAVYTSPDVDGCVITVHDNGKSQHVTIRQGGGWMPGDFEGMARERSWEYNNAEAKAQHHEMQRIWGYVKNEYSAVFHNDGFKRSEDYRKGWDSCVSDIKLWSHGDYHQMAITLAQEYNKAPDDQKEAIWNDNNQRVHNIMEQNNAIYDRYESSFKTRGDNFVCARGYIEAWNQVAERNIKYRVYRISGLGAMGYVYYVFSVDHYPKHAYELKQ